MHIIYLFIYMYLLCEVWWGVVLPDPHTPITGRINERLFLGVSKSKIKIFEKQYISAFTNKCLDILLLKYGGFVQPRAIWIFKFRPIYIKKYHYNNKKQNVDLANFVVFSSTKVPPDTVWDEIVRWLIEIKRQIIIAQLYCRKIPHLLSTTDLLFFAFKQPYVQNLTIWCDNLLCCLELLLYRITKLPNL